MMSVMERYGEQIYAGVLGKIIGVYLGRPVEGWSYEKIIHTFGDLPYYKHQACGVPLIVADDDISGTFAFFRAMEDSDYPKELTPQHVGNAWRNYIIEDKTILWWGGLGRSTEHTAFLNLKNGIPAPISGSIAQNGSTLAEQIGAQIFMDAFAMACPEDPELAVRLVRSAASVSHDGLAIDAARYLAAMEAMAFGEQDLNKLMDGALRFVSDKRLLTLIEDVRSYCAKERDWRLVREKIDETYGYHRYPGCCHMVPNHAMVLAALLLGEDRFQQSIRIAASAGYDTDCNAGNVGCLNGIRLGLKGIDAGADLRGPVRDQMYVVSSDGGAVITDAVQEALRIIRAAAELRDQAADLPGERFSFAFSGSVQGFGPCPESGTEYPNVFVEHALLRDGKRALAISCRGVGPGFPACVSTPTFLEKGKTAANFSTIASPTLYGTQTIEAALLYDGQQEVFLSPYVLYYDQDETVHRERAQARKLTEGTQKIRWTVPDTGGMPIFRVGLEMNAPDRFDGTIYLVSLNWKGAPANYRLEGMLMTSIWNTNPSWLQTWTSSAKQFQADFKYTVCVSHPEENGVATIGTADWQDYSVASRLEFSLHESGGLVLRCKGHRRYYGAVLREGKTVQILRRRDDALDVLAEAPFPYEEDRLYALEFACKGKTLSLSIDGKPVLHAEDSLYARGGAGLLIDKGSMSVDGFAIHSLEE